MGSSGGHEVLPVRPRPHAHASGQLAILTFRAILLDAWSTLLGLSAFAARTERLSWDFQRCPSTGLEHGARVSLAGGWPSCLGCLPAALVGRQPTPRSDFAVSHRLAGLPLPCRAGVLHPATSPGVRCVSARRASARRFPAALLNPTKLVLPRWPSRAPACAAARFTPPRHRAARARCRARRHVHRGSFPPRPCTLAPHCCAACAGTSRGSATAGAVLLGGVATTVRVAAPMGCPPVRLSRGAWAGLLPCGSSPLAEGGPTPRLGGGRRVGSTSKTVFGTATALARGAR